MSVHLYRHLHLHRPAGAGERAVGIDNLQLDLAKGEAQVGVRQQRARQQPCLAQHLEAVADPQHQPAVVSECDHRLHHRREARDRPRPQVVAIGEAAGHNDRVCPPQVTLAVPQQLRVADATGGLQRIDLVAGAGELEDAELHRSLATALASAGSMRSSPGISSKSRSGLRMASMSRFSACATKIASRMSSRS